VLIDTASDVRRFFVAVDTPQQLGGVARIPKIVANRFDATGWLLRCKDASAANSTSSRGSARAQSLEVSSFRSQTTRVSHQATTPVGQAGNEIGMQKAQNAI
jgi:hypothetical protein